MEPLPVGRRALLKTFEALEDLDGVAVTRLNIGQIEARRGHDEAALLELRTAYALNQQLGHAKGIATAGESLARLLAEQGGLGAIPPLEDAIAQYDLRAQTTSPESSEDEER